MKRFPSTEKHYGNEFQAFPSDKHFGTCSQMGILNLWDKSVCNKNGPNCASNIPLEKALKCKYKKWACICNSKVWKREFMAKKMVENQTNNLIIDH